MGRVLSFLINPKVIKTIGFLAVIMIIAFFGPTQPSWLKLVLIIAIIFIWLLIILAERQHAVRSGKSLEQALWAQADEQALNVKPDRKAEIEEIKQKFINAINALKNSKLGKGKIGDQVLYSLPWLMIIGPPSVGKTTAIKEAGLDIPTVDPSGEKQSAKGIGGTRNCDWWFTKDAILLDTAGRWTSDEEDKEEWLNFLKFLKRYRKKKPINGVMVAVSVEDFMNFSETQIEAQSQTIRNRIDELIKELGLIFPIYVVFTKCDLIGGFLEMFGDLSKAQRGQAWGYTISLDELRAFSFSPTTILENGMKELYKSLNSFRLTKLNSESKDERRNKIFFFPLQFKSLETKISLFIHKLFRENNFQETPMFRGFYFTSGTQEKNPIDILLEKMRQELGLVFSSHASNENVEKKSYFLTELFTKVMIPDQNLAGLTKGEKFKTKLEKVGLFAAVVLLISLFVIVEIGSYRLNKSYLTTVKDAAEAVEQIQSDATKPQEIIHNLGVLDQFRQILDRPTPFQRALGLDVGDKVNPAARRVYFNKIYKTILNPINIEIQNITNLSRTDIQDNYQYFYDTFKAYLMLIDSLEIDRKFLVNQLATINRMSADNEQVRSLMNAQMEYYIQYLDDENTPRLPYSMTTVSTIRRKLIDAKIMGPLGLYAKLKADGSTNFSPFDINEALNGMTQSVIVNEFKFPGMYTKAGWEDFVKGEIDNMGALEDDPVLKTKAIKRDAASLKKDKDEVTKYYFNDYKNNWSGFLNATKVIEFENLYQARQNLEKLSSFDQSPLFLLLQSLNENTDLTGGSVIDNVQTKNKTLNKLKKGFQHAETALSSPSAADQITRDFATLNKLMKSEAQTPSLINSYFTQVAKVYGKIDAIDKASDTGQEALKCTKLILQDTGNELKDALGFVALNTTGSNDLKNLLEQPIHHAWRVIAQEAQKYLNEQWDYEVYQKFNNFSRYFPFNKNNQDEAPIQDVEVFFSAEGIFWKFYQENLSDFIIQNHGRWELKNPPGGLTGGLSFAPACRAAFDRAEKIKNCVFDASGKLTFNFDIKPLAYKSSGDINPNIMERILTFDGQELIYNEGPQIFQSFTWAGANPGASLKVRTRDAGNMPDNAAAYNFSEGYWAIFRLLEKGELTIRQRSDLTYSWEFVKQDKYRVKLAYQFRSKTADNPFEKGLFSGFSCPSKIGE